MLVFTTKRWKETDLGLEILEQNPKYFQEKKLQNRVQPNSTSKSRPGAQDYSFK